MKLNELALKAKTQYSTWDNSNWHCYYHALSGDELNTQIISIFFKPTGDERSWTFGDVSTPYKINESDGIIKWIKETYGEKVTDADAKELTEYIIQFLNEAKIEYTGKPFTK